MTDPIVSGAKADVAKVDAAVSADVATAKADVAVAQSWLAKQSAWVKANPTKAGIGGAVVAAALAFIGRVL